MENEKEQQKAKIIERYKGTTSNDYEIIPAIAQPKLYDDNAQKRVAVYARVSTIDINQTTSYELQKNHYTDLINRHEGWNLAGIYADEGISGTSLNHRDSFLKMIEDCELGKIDLIVTKSVSRFARNTLDCLDYIRKLKNLPHPVGILFETENIYTLDNRSEMALSFLATMAQEESHIKSDIMNASLAMRFSRGILLTPALLGYDKDENGNLVINEEEAKTVKLIFYMYLYGNTCKQIANLLTEYGRKTKKGNTKWNPNSVLQILQNERHCGDVLTRKTWTPDYLTHKSKKNKQNLEQRRWKNQHEPIISRSDFMAVQELIKNAKYGNKGFLPELKVIKNGILIGFIIINPRWSAFTVEEYTKASKSISASDLQESKELEVIVKAGDFDLRNYQVVRSQFFDDSDIVGVTFSPYSISFTTECVRRLKNTQYIEILFNPIKNLFVVRKVNKNESRNAIKWSNFNKGILYSKKISAKAFMPTIYKVLDWNTDYKYRLRGIVYSKNNETFIAFNTKEFEIFINKEEENIDFLSKVKPFTKGSKKNIMAFPKKWADSFGENYYRQSQIKELENFYHKTEWKIKEEGEVFDTKFPDVTPIHTLNKTIENLKNNIKGDNSNNG